MQKVFFFFVMGRFMGKVSVQGYNIKSGQYKNQYVYGKSPQNMHVSVFLKKLHESWACYILFDKNATGFSLLYLLQ